MSNLREGLLSLFIETLHSALALAEDEAHCYSTGEFMDELDELKRVLQENEEDELEVEDDDNEEEDSEDEDQLEINWPNTEPSEDKEKAPEKGANLVDGWLNVEVDANEEVRNNLDTIDDWLKVTKPETEVEQALLETAKALLSTPVIEQSSCAIDMHNVMRQDVNWTSGPLEVPQEILDHVGIMEGQAVYVAQRNGGDGLMLLQHMPKSGHVCTYQRMANGLRISELVLEQAYLDDPVSFRTTDDQMGVVVY